MWEQNPDICWWCKDNLYVAFNGKIACLNRDCQYYKAMQAHTVGGIIYESKRPR